MNEQDKRLLGPDQQKIQPKLRMVANGSREVNSIRAEHCSAVAVDKKLAEDLPVQRGEGTPVLSKQELPEDFVPERGSLRQIPRDVSASVFIETLDRSEKVNKIPGQTAKRGNLVTATVPLSQLRKLSQRTDINYIELGEPLTAPTPEVSSTKPRPPESKSRGIQSSIDHKGGEGVLIGIIDVQGFDFSHPDFLDKEGMTRWVRIWDQAGNARPSPSRKGTFTYGAEFKAEHLNRAIQVAPELDLPAYEIEHQSQMIPGSHATHVASIAAGNSGVCPNAKIAGVLISLPQEDLDRRKSFYDSTRIVHAVDYLLRLAEELRMPVSINISLGTNGHAHDGSSPVSRWLDSALSVPGRCVCVSAGNSGQEVAAFDGDIGYIMGRIHSSGRIAARGLVSDIEWLVVGNGILDISENEFEVWYGPQDRFAISVKPPEGEWIGPVDPRQYIENQQLPDGSFISIYNELYHAANGANWISVYLSPLLSPEAVVGVPAGKWILRLHGLDIRNGEYHAWIERDDPRRVGRVGERSSWSFPSFFSQLSNVDRSTISSLACGHRVVSVANLDLAAERVNITSSQGPTRDGRFKPDVAAPGTGVTAARGFSEGDNLWVQMTGTSMASPYVAGVAGLMLAVEPRLTSAQIEGIIHRTSAPLPGGNFQWINDAGFGHIDPEACLEEASRIYEREDRTS